MISSGYTKKLDAENAKILMRCAPKRIVAEDATPEAIETCRRMGVELLLSPGAGTRVECAVVDVGPAGAGIVNGNPDAHSDNGACCGKCRMETDLSGLQQASPEEAEQIIGNTSIRMRLQYPSGDAESALPEAPEFGSIFEANAHALLAAGYIHGQTYEQCLEMAKWHPGMQAFMKMMGKDGTDTQKQQFGFARMYLLD